MRGARILAGSIIAAALLLGSCNDTKSTSLPAGSTMTVRAGEYSEAIEEIGVVESTRVVPILIPFRGRLIELIESGTPVHKGDVVAVMENQDAADDVKERLNDLKNLKSELEATIESLKIELRSSTLDRDLAESELEYNRLRLKDVTQRLGETEVLLQKAVVPEDDLREARSNAQSTKLSTWNQDLGFRSEVTSQVSEQSSSQSQIRRKELQSNRARRELDEAQERIDSAQIKAPITGMFLRTKNWNWQKHSMVEAKAGDSMRHGQVVGEIPDLESMIVRTQIAENYLTRVSEGHPVQLSFDALDGKVVEGIIKRIGKVAVERETSAGGAMMQTEGYSGQKVFEVEVGFHVEDPRLRPSMTAQVRIVLDRQEDVLTIPLDSIVRREGRPTVTVIGSNGKPEIRPVELGTSNGKEVVVTSGLRAGETIAKSGLALEASHGRRS
ncbi:HlyD family efflux transporter periplasmic adaptor subunit [bacterium]|nr:HlyD family efflux transporter periplasmic adaptor subunit [bacterium]